MTVLGPLGGANGRQGVHIELQNLTCHYDVTAMSFYDRILSLLVIQWLCAFFLDPLLTN